VDEDVSAGGICGAGAGRGGSQCFFVLVVDLVVVVIVTEVVVVVVEVAVGVVLLFAGWVQRQRKPPVTLSSGFKPK